MSLECFLWFAAISIPLWATLIGLALWAAQLAGLCCV
jgi:hypothetical protein